MAATLADLKAHLNVTSTSQDAELVRFLDAAVGTVENIVGPLASRSVTEIHERASDVIVLRQRPVQSVTSVAPYGWAGAGVPVVATTYRLDGPTGLLYLQYATSAPVQVTYVAGYATVPEAISTAVLVVAGRLYETQRGNAPSALPASDFDPNAFGTGGLPLLPPLAVTLLEPYRRGPTVA